MSRVQSWITVAAHACVLLLAAFPVAAAIPLAERNALVAFYNSTNGPGWTSRTGWLGAPGTECGWLGVRCDATQTTVTRIDLPVIGLSGSLPPELGDLVNLTVLYLPSNQIGGIIPPELGNLRNLTLLYLAYNALTGTIPPELGNLSNLDALWLAENQLTGSIPASIGSLGNLRQLALASNELSGPIPAALGNLGSLEELSLWDNNFTGPIPPELANLARIRYLSLANNNLTGPIPVQFANLANLEYLYLDSLALGGQIPPELGNLGNLIGLHLGYCNLSGPIPVELTNLHNLQDLRLNGNQLSGSIPSALGNLTQLRRLDLTSNQLEGSIPTSIGSLSNLEYFSVGRNGLTGSIPPSLGNLHSLQELHLGANQLSGSIPPELGALTGLTQLSLGNTQLSGPVPSELGNLSNLRYFSIRGSQLSGELPSSLANLAAVQYGWLDISYNSLVASDPAAATWATTRQADWKSTQTVAPTNLHTTTVTATAATLSWTEIPYTANNGRYEVWRDSGSGSAPIGSTPDKRSTSFLVTGLTPGSTHRFAVRTLTDPHENNQNALESGFSNEVTLVVPGTVIPAASVGDVSIVEGNAGSATATFVINLSAPSEIPASVQCATADGSASAGHDYVATASTLTFAPGETSKTILVEILSDTTEEPDETLVLNLSSPTNATVADAQGIATIVDDDHPPRVSVGDGSIVEGNGGLTATSVSVSLSFPWRDPVRVDWQTAAGSATAGSDFQPASLSTLSFNPGETTASVTVSAIGDTAIESDETFFVVLSNPVNATIADGQGEIVIGDDDAPPAQVPDPSIVVDGCTRIGSPCTFTARSASGADTSNWSYEWSLNGVAASRGTIWSPGLSQAGTYAVSLKVTNSAGSGSAATTIRLEGTFTCPLGTLCTLGGRFQLSLTARDHRTGATGLGLSTQKNDISGFFSIPALTFDASNPEVFVKVLDGRPINGNFWVFFGGLTDLEYTLTLNDSVAGTSKSYTKPGGSSQGGFDVGSGVAPETCQGEVDGTPRAAETPAPCAAGSDRHCLNSGRFRVTLAARDPRTGATGSGLSIPGSDLFGYFSIPALTNNPENPEVFVKVLDGRPINGHFWVFFSGLTDLGYTLTVTDTVTGIAKDYTKSPGSACGAFDSNAF